MIWEQRGSEWYYTDRRSDLAVVFRDFWGWWARDLRFPDHRLLAYSFGLYGIKRQVERIIGG